MDVSTLTPLDNPPSINALELHELLVTAYASGNVAQKRCIDALRALAESKLYLQLGFRDIAGYADATLHLRRTQTFECLRVSRALVHLPLVAAAFERGDVSFSLVEEMTRVAVLETQVKWLEFCEGRPTRAVLAELKDAHRKKLDCPREDGFGLPGLPVKVAFELSPEEHGVLERGLAKVACEMAESLDGAKPSPKEALLYLLHRVLKTEPAQSVTGERKELSHSPWTMVFHRCPDCRRGTLETEDGRVEIEESVLDRVEGGADHVVIEDEASRRVRWRPRNGTGPTRPRFVVRSSIARAGDARIRFAVAKLETRAMAIPSSFGPWVGARI